MKVIIIRLKNILLNMASFSIIIGVFFITKPFRKKTGLKIKNVTWFGAYGNGNLGDDLIFYSLKRLLDHNDFKILLSIRDLKKSKFYGVPIFVKGEQFYDFYKYLNKIKSADTVFLGGGGLLEYYYPSKQAYRMIMIYLCPLMIARIFNKPTFVLGMGVNKERIDKRFIRYVYRHVLSECELIVTRDEKSKQGLIKNGVSTKIINSYDPVLSLNFNFDKSKTQKKKIGFLLWPYFKWPHFYENSASIGSKKEHLHNNFVKKIKQLIESLIPDYELHFLTFHFSDTLLYKELNLKYPKKAKLNTFIKQVSNLDLLVSMRYHGQITSFLNKTPVIALSVQQKMDALMKNYEMEQFNNDIYNLSVEKIINDIRNIFNSEEEIVKHIQQKNNELRASIEQTYKSINFSK